MTKSPAIACTLSPGEYVGRLRWIMGINRAWLRGHVRDGRTLVLTYAPVAADEVRELAEQEGRCCAFLTFRVDETPEAIQLTVLAPTARVALALDVGLTTMGWL